VRFDWRPDAVLLRMLLIELQRAEANDRAGVVYFEKNALLADPGVVACMFLLRCNSYLS
jgi:hypothetical protein